MLASSDVLGGGSMDSRDIIQAGLNYIECNLKADISVRELADAAGFSLYHYYRVFCGSWACPYSSISSAADCFMPSMRSAAAEKCSKRPTTTGSIPMPDFTKLFDGNSPALHPPSLDNTGRKSLIKLTHSRKNSL